jgi:hypothetical protein
MWMQKLLVEPQVEQDKADQDAELRLDAEVRTNPKQFGGSIATHTGTGLLTLAKRALDKRKVTMKMQRWATLKVVVWITNGGKKRETRACDGVGRS